MKHLLRRFIKNKTFIIWCLSIIFILYFLFNPLLASKTEYMLDKNISEYCYIYYAFLLPMSFYDMGFITCLLLELVYFSLIVYISVSFINLFFRETSSVTLTRMNRDKWIKDIININLKFSIVISLFYVLFFYSLCFINNVNFDITIQLIIPIIYKVIITCIIPLIFINVFITSDSEVISIIFSIVSSLFIQLVIKASFSERTVRFDYSLAIILMLICIYYLLKKVIINNFKRRDV